MAKGKQGNCFQIVNTGGEIDDETGQPLYWNNKLGWVDRVSATRFTMSEKKKLHAPLDGKFVVCKKG